MMRAGTDGRGALAEASWLEGVPASTLGVPGPGVGAAGWQGRYLGTVMGSGPRDAPKAGAEPGVTCRGEAKAHTPGPAGKGRPHVL